VSLAIPDDGSAEQVEIRRSRPDDDGAILDLLGRCLGWSDDDRFVAYFRWKHVENPFGTSPAWVATAAGRIVGFRSFMRWDLVSGSNPVRAVRAVDTATDPAWQRRGIFSSLTTAGLTELRAEGTELVFNTPNDKSRPGYLKLGWREVGQVPVAIRPISPWALPKLAAERLPPGLAARLAITNGPAGRPGESRWSQPSGAGMPAAEWLADRAVVAELLDSQPVGGTRLRTLRSVEYLQWRYRFEPLGYRSVPAGRSPSDGCVVLRVRRRGRATEASVAEVLVPGGDARKRRRALAAAARAVDADYLLLAGADRAATGFVPLPGQGPRLTSRGLSDAPAPPMESWALGLGDLELF